MRSVAKAALASVLQALDVPRESQMLVFSKTASRPRSFLRASRARFMLTTQHRWASCNPATFANSLPSGAYRTCFLNPLCSVRRCHRVSADLVAHQRIPHVADRIDSAVEEMVKYMMFTNEAKLEAPLHGTSGFAEAFQKAGLRAHASTSVYSNS